MRLVALTPLSSVAPVALANPQAAAVGVSATAMRADAKPQVPNPATPSTQAFGDAAAQGAGAGFATDTHKHAMMASPHIEGKTTPGSAAGESVTWAVAYAGTPIVVTCVVDAAISTTVVMVTARSTTGATVFSGDSTVGGAVNKPKILMGCPAT